VIAGELAWLMLSLSGLALIAQQVPFVFIGIKWAGMAYLI
jgi:threonine/homoserine/homoserine lactone efflux protein